MTDYLRMTTLATSKSGARRVQRLYKDSRDRWVSIGDLEAERELAAWYGDAGLARTLLRLGHELHTPFTLFRER